jgi:hypothetical protein
VLVFVARGEIGSDFSILVSEFSLLLLEWLLGREGLRFWQVGLFCRDRGVAWFGALWRGLAWGGWMGSECAATGFWLLASGFSILLAVKLGGGVVGAGRLPRFGFDLRRRE